MSLTGPDIDIDVASFAAGYLDTPEEDTLPPGACPDGGKNSFLVNVELQDQIRARLRKRTGHRLITPTALAARYDGLFRFDRENAASELIGVANGELRRWDGATTMTLIGSGFTASRQTRALAFKNSLHVCDGLVNKRYDGTALLPDGFAAPTAAPALAVAAGPGVTGTYEGFALWYDSVADHESSPSAISAQVAFANQQRQWAKPAGAPPANVTHWRIYCRRVDTNENRFFRVAPDAAIGAATLTEATSDANRKELGPEDNSNDVPPAFALMEEWKGFRIGVTDNSSEVWISKEFDAESQHPKNRFPVGGKGDTKPIRSVRKYGAPGSDGLLSECLIQKPTRTYRLVGDRLPFKIEPIGSSFGNVNHEAGLEVDGLFFGWDEVRGPYRTNLTTWTALADGRIRRAFGRVNRAFAHKIVAVHYADLQVLVWLVPVDTTGRLRTGLPYQYKLDRWFPPVTGLEYTAGTEFTTSGGELGTYVGDEWGRLFKLFDTENDGVPSGTLQADITAATSGTITAAAAAFYTTGSGLRGLRAAVRSPAGVWQWVRISSNTGTVLTLDTVNGPSLNPVPAGAGWIVIVGGIEWEQLTARHTGGKRMIEKKGWHIHVQAAVTSGAHILEAQARYDRSIGYADSYEFTFPVAGLVWGVGSWGVGAWGSSGSVDWVKARIGRSFEDVQYLFRNYYPNQPIELTGYRITADWLRRKVAR